MKTLAWRCATIIGWVVLFTEFDLRTDYFELAAPGYAMAAAAVVLLVIPALRRTSILRAIAFAFPLFCALELANGPIDARGAAAALLEFAAIGVTIALAASLGRRLSLAEDVLNEFAVGPSRGAIEPFSRTQGEMFREVRRARRHARPLSLLALSASGPQPPTVLAQLLEEARRDNADRYVAAKVASLLDEQTAGSTVIADRGDHFLLLLPEAGRAEAEQLARRLERGAAERHGIRLGFGIASFPAQEVTFDKLLESAEAELRGLGQAQQGEETAGEENRLAPPAPAGS